MTRFVSRRALQGLAVVFGAVTISFILASLSGNAIDARYTNLDAETRAELVAEYGYDKPILERYGDFLTDVVRGDFGPTTGAAGSPLEQVFTALPYTLTLVFAAIAVAAAVALMTATFGVVRRASRADVIVRRTFLLLQGIPEFFLGLVLVLVFAVQLGWLPSFGATSAASYVLPVIALATPLISTLTRLLRAQLLEVLGSDFIVALRARGLTERRIVLRHGLANVAPPLVTYLALQMGWLIGGTIVVEVVFGIPGIGALAVTAAQAKDMATIQAIVVVVAIGYVVLNLVADLIVLAIDPRVRAAT